MTEAHPTTRPLEDDAPWRVLKFGGTSVTGSDRLDVIARVVEERLATCRPVVVVSAQAGITDLLSKVARQAASGVQPDDGLSEITRRHADAAREAGLDETVVGRLGSYMEELDRLLRGISLVEECSPRTLDQVLAIGERASSELVAAALDTRGVASVPVDAADLIVTDDTHGRANVDFAATDQRAAPALAALGGRVPVVTGFLGATARGERTTLGRGGSDYSAAVLGWALRAQAVEIWTDVDGVLTADPRTVPGARPLRSLAYAELLELSHWGARVVHPKTVHPLRERGIPMMIRNTLSPDDPGTTVVPEADAFPDGPVRGVASIDDVSIVQLNGFGRQGHSVAARLLGALDRAGVTVLLVTQACSERSVCVALPTSSVGVAVDVVRREFELERRAGTVEDLIVETECAIVAAVGTGMRDFPGIAGQLFGVLGERGINVRAIAQGSSELNISCVVSAADAAAAVRAVHDAFLDPDVFSDDADQAPPSADWDTITADVVDLTRRLIAIPSVTGRERRIMRYVARILESRGWDVTRQLVANGRENVWATRGGLGEVTLSTHLDTVPGPHGHKLADGRVYGRGACDAKGIAAAMLCAAERLVESGEERFDLLFVVGEEGGSDGARAANGLPATSRYLVNGEPTEGVLASAAKGTLRLVLSTTGVEAHSAYPERGRSAIDAMLALLSELGGVELPADEALGPTTVNVGTVSGGTAANVVAGACQAEMMIRLVSDPDPVKEVLERWVDGRAEMEWGSYVPIQRFHTLEGWDTAPVGYTSDAPLLPTWGTPLLYGPGSIHVAHTPNESVSVADLHDAVEGYVRIVRELLDS
jgi:aspartate kinase